MEKGIPIKLKQISGSKEKEIIHKGGNTIKHRGKCLILPVYIYIYMYIYIHTKLKQLNYHLSFILFLIKSVPSPPQCF